MTDERLPQGWTGSTAVWRVGSPDLDRLREALKQYDDGEAGTHQVSELAVAARRFLALTETGPDYEAAFDYYLTETGSCRQKAMEGAVDAALADYLTEEET